MYMFYFIMLFMLITEEVQNWFKNNNVYLINHYNNGLWVNENVYSILLNITYNSPPYANRIILSSSNSIIYSSGDASTGSVTIMTFVIGHYSNLIGTVYNGYNYNISNHYDFLINSDFESWDEDISSYRSSNFYRTIVGYNGTNIGSPKYYGYSTLKVNGTEYSRTSTLIDSMVNKLKNIRDVYTIYQEIVALGGTP